MEVRKIRSVEVISLRVTRESAHVVTFKTSSFFFLLNSFGMRPSLIARPLANTYQTYIYIEIEAGGAIRLKSVVKL